MAFLPLKLAILITTIAFTLLSPAAAQEFSTALPPPPPPPFLPLLEQHNEATSPLVTLLASILSGLGFQELAMAAPSLADYPSLAAWSEPFTIFALTDASIRSCASCSVPRLLREHIVPGLLPLHHLRNLAFGSQIETLAPGRCVTVTSAAGENFSLKIFVGGVEITRPDLFDDGFVVVHGLEGRVSHLSPFSCSSVERATPASLPFHHPQPAEAHPVSTFPIMRLMLKDAMVRLRIAGYSIVALALRVKYSELIGLQNMTLFALDDFSIFSGGHSYVSNVRLHIVPNQFLTDTDLQKLPEAAVLRTLELGQMLVVTTPGGGPTAETVSINYVRIKSPQVMRNLKISVHALSSPFPRLNLPATAMGFGGSGRPGMDPAGASQGAEHGGVPGQDRSCEAWEMDGVGCAAVPPAPEIEDHHGL